MSIHSSLLAETQGCEFALCFALRSFAHVRSDYSMIDSLTSLFKKERENKRFARKNRIFRMFLAVLPFYAQERIAHVTVRSFAPF